MNLLEKMDAIDVKADTRISGADRYFCETHQRAFDAAHRDLLALWKSWKTIEMQQREILEAAESSHMRMKRT